MDKCVTVYGALIFVAGLIVSAQGAVRYVV